MKRREIKFRIWDSERLYLINPVWFEENSWGSNDLNICAEEVNCILMQYTGIKDKNGLEIYEGDIVKTDENHFCRCDSDWVKYKKGEIMWINAGFKVCEELIGANDLSIYSMCNCEPSCSSGLIIIGNIYEGIKEDENYK